MKRLFLIHRWDGDPDSDWYPWLKEKLESEFKVDILEMPDTSSPKIEKWVESIREHVGDVDNYTYFVGHSIGCQAILRFLETLNNEKIGDVVLVAPWVRLPVMSEEENEIARPWVETPLNWEKIKTKAKSFTAIFSDNDPFVGLDQVEIFKQNLGAEIIIEKSRGHMTEEDGVTENQTILKILGG